nr:unnamed protein product [Callosobruchus analis]
MYMVMLLR